ncbi:MAG: phospholipid/cholesterol/gamma-HCH transport system substrate-binding protein [Mycobacterium sp.]|jgi:phospholipid/cholesterol/gamma-HCH transport system substrate-binding protein|nr:phospholipid/cholesterol/gamma-HCH transport system substrate-binding protein [Mycobacterium sp.]
MHDTPRRRRLIRLSAAILAGLLLGCAVLTYLSYTAAFTPTDTVTVTAARAGLVMEPDAKVKYLGVQVGNVVAIDYTNDHAQLTLAIESDQLGFIPSNAIVRIASTTVFGAKSVEFVPPDQPAATALVPNAHVVASAVSVEVNTLFETLTNTLHKIDPVELNATLSALSQGLRGNGDNLGATLAGISTFLAQLNPKLSTLQQDFQKTATVTNDYADAAPDLITGLDNVPSISKTIVDEQGDLTATLLATTGLAKNGYATLAPAADDYIAAIQRLRIPAKVLGDYSPGLGCLIKAIAIGNDKVGPYIGGIKPGLFISSSFLPGVPAYTYPESLPIVNASGGPNCRGLPDLPTKQNGGSWYHPPFLVTDNAYVPFQPNTELQFDAPSTLQFLFHGAYAERDDY